MSLLQAARHRAHTGELQRLREVRVLRRPFIAVLLLFFLLLLFLLVRVARLPSWEERAEAALQEQSALPRDDTVSLTTTVLPKPLMREQRPAKPVLSAEIEALYRAAASQPPATALPEPDAAVDAPDEPATLTDAAALPSSVLLDVEAIASEAERALAKPVRLAHPVPFLGELPQQRRDRVPSLRYEQHIYETAAPDAARIFINGSEYGQGESIGNGIDRKSVV